MVKGGRQKIKDFVKNNTFLYAFVKALRRLCPKAIGIPPDVLVIESRPYIGTKRAAEGKLSEDDIFYLEFENIFRGSQDIIKERQKQYITHVKEVYRGSSFMNKYFFDIGCGRGEFLKLLRENKIVAKGLEINAVTQKCLKDDGFDVELGDANTALEKIPDGYLTGVSAFQVVEHLKPDYLKKFVELSYRKIDSGGLIILETVNSKCAFALSNFYLDITHVRPYPPEVLKFLLEWYGFADVKTVYSSPCPHAFMVKGASDHNYMDFAVIGYKR